MQNLDKITDRIIADAASQAEKILADAEAACAGIEDEASAEAKTIVEGAKRRAERDGLAVAERAYSAADMKKREIILATRVGLINKVFKEAKQYLLDLGEEDYAVMAGHLLADAAAERIETVQRLRDTYGDEEDDCLDFEVLFSASDRETKAPVIIKAARTFMRRRSAAMGKTDFRISNDCADIDGGVILRYGDIETNCSFDAVIADAREKYEARVAEILFSVEEKQDMA